MPQSVMALPFFHLTGGATTRAAALFSTRLAASRRDPQCVQDTCLLDAEQYDRVIVLEEWESEAALIVHDKHPHVAAFLEQITSLLAVPFAMTITPTA